MKMKVEIEVPEGYEFDDNQQQESIIFHSEKELVVYRFVLVKKHAQHAAVFDALNAILAGA